MYRRPLEVVWIAPQVGPDLAWLAEIGAMAGMPGVNVREICGPEVGQAAVSRGLCEPADMVIWSGHGQQDSRGEYVLAVPRGRPVRGAWLATQAMRAAPVVFIGAACGTSKAGGHLESIIDPFSEAGINAVGFPDASVDDAAGVYIVEFVRAMRAKRDVGRAHRVALEEAGGEDLCTARGVILKPALTNGYRDLLDRMDGMDEQLIELRTLVERVAREIGVARSAGQPGAQTQARYISSSPSSCERNGIGNRLTG